MFEKKKQNRLHDNNLVEALGISANGEGPKEHSRSTCKGLGFHIMGVKIFQPPTVLSLYLEIPLKTDMPA